MQNVVSAHNFKFFLGIMSLYYKYFYWCDVFDKDNM